MGLGEFPEELLICPNICTYTHSWWISKFQQVYFLLLNVNLVLFVLCLDLFFSTIEKIRKTNPVKERQHSNLNKIKCN